MSNPNCRPPVCSFNCCDSNGSCPTSQDQCRLYNPVWIYIVIGVVILLVLVFAVIVLVVFRRRRQRQEQENRLQEQAVSKPDRPVEVELKEEQPKVVVNQPPVKKSIYVYEREAPDEDILKNSGAGSATNSKRSFRQQNSQHLQNPFQKNNRIRNRLL